MKTVWVNGVPVVIQGNTPVYVNMSNNRRPRRPRTPWMWKVVTVDLAIHVILYQLKIFLSSL